MRTKKKVTTLINAEEVPEQVRKFATATSKIKNIESEIELEKQSIVKRYEARLQSLNDQRDESFENLQNYAEANPELFTKTKSLDFANGRIGFRKGTPKVDKVKKFTWDGIIEQLKALAPTFVRSKEEVNKELVIANRDDKEVMATLASAGISVTQEETFFVEAKEEDLVTA